MIMMTTMARLYQANLMIAKESFVGVESTSSGGWRLERFLNVCLGGPRTTVVDTKLNRTPGASFAKS